RDEASRPLVGRPRFGTRFGRVLERGARLRTVGGAGLGGAAGLGGRGAGVAGAGAGVAGALAFVADGGDALVADRGGAVLAGAGAGFRARRDDLERCRNECFVDRQHERPGQAGVGAVYVADEDEGVGATRAGLLQEVGCGSFASDATCNHMADRCLPCFPSGCRGAPQRLIFIAMATLTIDGRSVTADPDRTILEAARAAGMLDIPTLCWYP